MCHSIDIRCEEHPGEIPSVYAIRSDNHWPLPNWHVLWVDEGQNMFSYRDGVRTSRQWYQEIQDFLDGRSQYSTLKDLYWACYDAKGYEPKREVRRG